MRFIVGLVSAWGEGVCSKGKGEGFEFGGLGWGCVEESLYCLVNSEGYRGADSRDDFTDGISVGGVVGGRAER